MQKLLISFYYRSSHIYQNIVCNIPTPFVVFTNCIGGKHKLGKDCVEKQLQDIVAANTDMNSDNVHIVGCDVVTISESVHFK